MNYFYTQECLAEFLKNIGTWALIRLAELFYRGTGLILNISEASFRLRTVDIGDNHLISTYEIFFFLAQ